MKLLLDTHALLWWLADTPQLGPKARGAIADPANDILVSIVSVWEIAVKVRTGKLEAKLPSVIAAIERNGFSRLAISDAHLQTLMTLPVHHRNPFDHLLIAQAVADGATLITSDRHAPRYAVQIQSALA